MESSETRACQNFMACLFRCESVRYEHLRCGGGAPGRTIPPGWGSNLGMEKHTCLHVAIHHKY